MFIYVDQSKHESVVQDWCVSKTSLSLPKPYNFIWIISFSQKKKKYETNAFIINNLQSHNVTNCNLTYVLLDSAQWILNKLSSIVVTPLSNSINGRHKICKTKLISPKSTTDRSYPNKTRCCCMLYTCTSWYHNGTLII